MPSGPEARLPIGATLIAGWQLFRTCLPVLFGPLWAASFVSAVPGVLADGGLLSASLSPGDLLLMLAAWCIQSLLYGYSIARMDARARDAGIPAGQAWHKGWRAAPAILIGDFVYNIAAWGGLLVFVVPGIILATTLAFFAYAAVLDRKNVLDALAYSHALAWPNWWCTSAVISAPAIVLLVYDTIAAWPAVMSATQSLARGELPTAESMASPAWYGLGLMPVLAAVVWVYVLAVLYVQYRALKARAADH